MKFGLYTLEQYASFELSFVTSTTTPSYYAHSELTSGENTEDPSAADSLYSLNIDKKENEYDEINEYVYLINVHHCNLQCILE